MTTRPHMRPRVRHLVLPLVLALAAALLAAPALANSHKNFTLHISPLVVPGGNDAQAFAATLTNQSPQQQLGSADVTVPKDFGLGAVDNPPTVNGLARGTATKHGNVIRLRNLSAPPNATIVVTFRASTPCATGTYDFGAVAKQANNFSGPPGNNLDFNAEESARSVTVSSGCALKLAFVDDRQPANTVKSTVITSSAFASDGAPVQVEAIDAAGEPAVSFTGSVTVALDSNPTGASLGGTTTVAAVDGVATFDDLTIARTGVGYTLKATSTGLTPAISEPFGIFDDGEPCEPREPCNTEAGTLEDSGMHAKASGRGGAAGGSMGIGLGLHNVDCGDSFNHFPHVVTLEAPGVTDKVVQVTIAKDVVQAQPNSGVAHYQVCMSSPDAPFTDRFGNEEVTLGLLPDCGPPSPFGPPCVRSRTKTGAGDVVILVELGGTSRSFR